MRRPELTATKTPTPATTPALPIFLNSFNKRTTKRIDCCCQSTKPFPPSHELPQHAKNGDDGTETSQQDLHTCNHLTALIQNLTSALSLSTCLLNIYAAHQKHTKKATNKTDFRSLQTTSILHQMASNLVLSTRLLLAQPSFNPLCYNYTPELRARTVCRATHRFG